MKEILLFTPFVGQGNCQRVTEALAYGLSLIAPGRGWRIDVLGQPYTEGGETIKYPESFFFTQIEPKKPLPKHPNLINFLRNNARTFVNHLREVAPAYDLIICPNAFWSTALEWDIKTPIIALIPDLGWDMVDMGEFLDMFLSESACRIAESAAFSVFTGEWHRRLGVERYGFTEAKTAVIPNSAEIFTLPALFSPKAVERERINYNLPERYILMHNAMGFHGMDIGLIGYMLAKTAKPDLPPLVLSGYGVDDIRAQSTPYGKAIYALITNNLGFSLETDVILTGIVAREALEGVIGGASMALFPSRVDGDVSGSMLEAIQGRVPVIFSNLPVFTDRLGKDDRFGLSFEVDDAQELGRCILKVLDEPEAAAARAKAAFDWAQQYSLHEWVKAYASLFETAMQTEAGGINVV